MSDDLDRRSFIERLAALAAVGDLGRQPIAGAEPGASRAAPVGTFNGIQMGPHTILDEGIERTLDLIADTAAINAVMPYSHAYNAALIKPLRDRADHGVPARRVRRTGRASRVHRARILESASMSRVVAFRQVVKG